MNQEKIELIPLDAIGSSDGNRKHGGFDPVKLQELADSIKAAGVLQPVLVRKNPDPAATAPEYELVAGERRWRAARLAGLQTVPCLVRELDDITCLKIQTIENLQREDLHPLDEADGYARLIERAGYDVDHLALEVGRSPSYVYQRLKLRELIPEAQRLLLEGKMTAGHAILIARLQPKSQASALKELVGWNGEPISVRHLGDWIQRSVLMELSKACWKLDDADLVAKAGSCQACPKRTGYQPALFADVCSDGKKDYCLDRACFAKKQQAILARRRAELTGVPHLEAVSGYTGGQTPRGALAPWDWTECKKSEPGAKRVLIVGGESPGRLTYGKARKEATARVSPEAKAERQKQERKEAVEQQYRKELYARTVAAAAKKLKQSLSKEVLRLVVRSLYQDSCDNGELGELEGWESEEAAARAIGKMDEATLRLTLLKLALAQHIEYASWNRGGDTLLEAAKFYQVDLKAARKEAGNQVKAGAQQPEASE